MRRGHSPGLRVNRRYERRTTLVLGPLEYLIVGFEGNRFTGQILVELRAAQENGVRLAKLYLSIASRMLKPNRF